jgi:preprotein translocase subunit YajC
MEPTTITFLVIVGILAAFYLTIIRPARNEQRKVERTIRDLSPGDEIITTAGFFGVVREIITPEEGPVQIVVDFGNGVRVRALTTSVLRRVSEAPQPAERPAEEGT